MLPTLFSRRDPKVSPDKLEALLATSDAMLESLFGHKSPETLDSLTTYAKLLLSSESCSIFLVTKDDPNYVQLESSISDKLGLATTRDVRLKIHQEPRGGLTGYLASRREVLRLNHREIKQSPYLAQKPSDYLASGNCYSVLALPLLDRKNHYLGLIKAVNKKSPSGRVAREPFTTIDETFGRIFARKVSIILEHIRIIQGIEQLTFSLSQEFSLGQLVDSIAKKATELLGAHRGDILLWNEVKHNLVYAGRAGNTDAHAIRLGNPAPDQSVVRQLWVSRKQAIRIDDVNNHSGYALFSKRTKSELAVILGDPATPLGIVNVESLQENGFDQQDEKTLLLFSDKAATIIEDALGKTTFHGVSPRTANRQAIDEEFLDQIIEGVMQPLGVESGQILLADENARALEVVAYVDEDSELVQDRHLPHDLAGSSRSAWIFNEKQSYFTEQAETDTTLDHQGKKKFNIQGPWIGIPMMFGVPVVGVLIFWNRRVRVLNETYLNSLQPFARLVASICFKDADSPAPHQPSIKNLNKFSGSLIQTEQHLPKWTLQVIFMAIIAGRFDRARLFVHNQDHSKITFIAGLGHEDNKFQIGTQLDASQNPYTKSMISTFFYDRTPRIFSSIDLGPDPAGDQIGKPDYLSWAQMPVVLGGKLIGHLAVDNAVTERPLTFTQTESLSLAGRLISRLSDHALQLKRDMHYRDLLDNLPITAWEKDKNGVFTFVNNHFARLMRCTPSQIVGRTDLDVFKDPKLCEAYESGDQETMATGEVVLRRKEKFRPADGNLIFADVVKSPVYDSAGRIVGTRGMWMDVTSTIEELKRSEEQLLQAQQMASIGSLRWDADTRKSHPSDGMRKIFGFDCDLRGLSFSAIERAVVDKDIIVKHLVRLLPNEIDILIRSLPGSLHVRSLVESFRHNTDNSFDHGEKGIEFRIRRGSDLEERIIFAKLQVERDQQGELIQLTAMAQDVTDAKLLLKQKDLLLREMHHRMNNQLMQIANIFTRAELKAADERFRLILLVARSRLKAIALVNEFLYYSEDIVRVDFPKYIEKLTDQLRATYAADGGQIKLELKIPQLLMPYRYTIPCGMIVAELVCNALKHAFPEQQPGRIIISLEKAASGKLALSVEDDGVGFKRSLQTEASSASGLELVNGLVNELKGTISITNTEGSSITVTFQDPLNQFA